MKLMKYIYLFILATIFVSCEDSGVDVTEYSPKIVTKNVEVKPDGTVWVAYELVSKGKDEVEWIGCSMDTVPNPSFQSNLNMATYRDGNTYYSVYNVDEFDSTKTYYFKPFANNVYGLSYGQIAQMNSIKPIPVEVPCNNPLNQFEFLGSTRYFSYVSDIWYLSNYYEIEASTSGIQVDISFLTSPRNGIYKTTYYEYPDESNEVRVSITSFSNYYVLADANVYVNEIDAETLEITICDARHSGGQFGGDYPFYMRIRTSR